MRLDRNRSILRSGDGSSSPAKRLLSGTPYLFIMANYILELGPKATAKEK